MPMITSAQNPRLQAVRALLNRRAERDARSAFVVEGVRLAEEALAGGWTARLVLTSAQLSERGRQAAAGFAARGADLLEVEPRLLDSLSGTESPQGILAVLERRDLPLPPAPDFLVVADGIRDPGNLGTLLRTCAAAGVQAVLLAPGTVDPFSPKVLRAGMGAHFRLPIRQVDWQAIHSHCRTIPPHPLNILLADASGGTPLWHTDLHQPVALVIGGEAEGASPQAIAALDDRITIPMPGRFESLNAAVAAAIILFEVVRQRNA